MIELLGVFVALRHPVGFFLIVLPILGVLILCAICSDAWDQKRAKTEAEYPGLLRYVGTIGPVVLLWWLVGFDLLWTPLTLLVAIFLAYDNGPVKPRFRTIEEIHRRNYRRPFGK